MDRRQKHKIPSIVFVLIALFVIIVLIFVVQKVVRIGLFAPGELIFTDNLSEDQRAFLNGVATDLVLDSDLTIDFYESTTADPSGLLYNVLVPVTDFYDPAVSISAGDARSGQLLSVLDLTPQVKLLALDDIYYLDHLDQGAFFQYFRLDGKTSDVELLTTKLHEKLPTFPTKDTVLSFAQTGVTALSRNMNTKLDEVKDASYFAEKIAPYLSGFDLTHTSNESSFSSAASATNICAKPGMIDALTSISLDIVELTGNHNQDCGDEDALATIKQYRDLGIKIVGGGETATTAAEPLIIDEKDTHITLLGYNLSTGGYTLDDTPGANFYTREKALADIAAAKDRGDFIIVDVQYYECPSYVFESENTICDYANSAAGDQVGFFRELIDMGADVVVGTAAHQPQTFELYKGGVIYYGLGNLFFDQSWWPGTTRSLILAHYFWNGNLLQTRIVPTIYDSGYQTQLLDNATTEWFIKRLTQARPTEVK